MEDPKPAPKPSMASTSSDSPTARLQLRLPEGNPLSTTVDATATLRSVVDWLMTQRPDLVDVRDSLKFAMTFPRKVFSADELNKSVKELGLTPSAALMVSR